MTVVLESNLETAGLLRAHSTREHASKMAAGAGEFYLRYYVGHKGKFGHEFLEFEFRPDGKFVTDRDLAV